MLNPRRVHPLSSLAARRGMTLIELILVMALLSVILAYSTPALSNFFKGRKSMEEARRMLSLTRYAHSEAISRAEPMEMWFNLERKIYGLRPQYVATGGAMRSGVNGSATYAQAPAPSDSAAGGQSDSGALYVTYTDESGRRMPAFHLAEGLELELDNKRFDSQGNVVIRFLADGTIDEESPANIILREVGRNDLILTRSEVGVGYQIVNR